MKAKPILLMALLATSLIFFNTLALATASPETMVYVDPQEIRDLMPPAQFTIRVKISNVVNFYGVDIQFTWNPNIIKCVSHQKHIPVENYPDGVLHSPTLPVKDQVNENDSIPDAEPGTRYWLVEASMLPAATFNGNGTIFEMTFQVVGLGSSPLRIVTASLSDQNGNAIPYKVQQGRFINYVPPPAKIFVNPKAIVNSSLGPCNNFTVSVNVTGVENLYSFDFWLGFNASVLEVLQAAANPQFPPATIVYKAEEIEVSASLVSPAPSISGDLYLASIRFHILAEGKSALDLHNVTLLDDGKNPIGYSEPGDGYFNNLLISKIPASIWFKPTVFNLKSRGKWTIVYIEISDITLGYNVTDIDVSSIKLNDTVPVDLTAPTKIGDDNNNTIQDLMVKFNRTQIAEYIISKGITYANVTLTVTGKLLDNTLFEGSTIVKISALPGDVNCDGTVDIYDIVKAGASYRSMEDETRWNPNANWAPPWDRIDMFDLVTIAYHYGEKIGP